tara:strand:+ start:503 stop:1243 length:741 start_codon:yes stop_codon:yes gene_type:complete
MKVAIVTGGNKGIGLELSKNLLKNNYKVIVGGRSSYIDKETINKIDFLKADLTRFEEHKKLVEKAIKNYGQLDLYVNNVGISDWRPIEKVDKNFLDKLISTNLYSAFWGCKAAEPYLNTKGSIINISSLAGKRGSKNNSVYVSTKFAMNGLTQSLSKELGSRNIRVNAICPVLIKTEGLLKALEDKYSPASSNVDDFLIEFTNSQTALNRLPTGREVAEMVVFLASEKASAITGQCINVDCGVFPQ